MEKRIPIQQQQQQQQPQETLKCPRCESSNTKFCYYNNYSLSQPRHFCKACKRYWTRGGTLRNVPVGGGCRKNKRVKRPITTHVSATSAPVVDHHHNTNPNLDHNSSQTTTNGNSNHHLNPLFYGLLPQNPNFPRFDHARVSGYDLVQPNMNDLGLGFSSRIVPNHGQISDSTLSSYPNSSMFGGGSASSSTAAPTIASLLASSRQQQQRFMGFEPYDEGGSSSMKDLIMEGTQNRMGNWDHNFHGQNHHDQMEAVGSSDPNSGLWNTAGGGGGWLDPTNNLGSSVPSLI